VKRFGPTIGRIHVVRITVLLLDRESRWSVSSEEKLTSFCFFILLQLRVVCYVLSSAVEDEETQRRGVVSLVYSVGPMVGEFNSEVYQGVLQIIEWLPIRI
jgi:hypothetical protein